MVTVVDAVTTLVLTVKVAVVAPAGTATLEATLVAPLLLESATCAPPVGAGPLNVTVGRGDSDRGRRSHGTGADREGCAGGSGGNRQARRYASRPVVTRKRHLRITCGCCSAQRYCAGRGIPARNTGRVQRKRRNRDRRGS